MKNNKKTLMDKILPKYIVNKWIFRIGFLLLIVYFFVGFGIEGFENKAYVTLECPVELNTPCFNPFYNPSGLEVNPTKGIPDSIKGLAVLPSGFSYVVEPNVLLKGSVFASVFIFILCFCFLLNHLLYNKYYKKPKLNWKELEK